MVGSTGGMRVWAEESATPMASLFALACAADRGSAETVSPVELPEAGLPEGVLEKAGLPEGALEKAVGVIAELDAEFRELAGFAETPDRDKGADEPPKNCPDRCPTRLDKYPEDRLDRCLEESPDCCPEGWVASQAKEDSAAKAANSAAGSMSLR